MKNLLVVNNAINCTFDVFGIDEETFFNKTYLNSLDKKTLMAYVEQYIPQVVIEGRNTLQTEKIAV